MRIGMYFKLQDFLKAMVGGLGLGFGFSSLVPIVFPSVVYTDYIAKCGAVSGAVVLGALYLFSVWIAE